MPVRFTASLLAAVLIFAIAGPLSAGARVTLVVRYVPDIGAAPTDRTFLVARGQILVVEDLEYGATIEDALIEIRDSGGGAAGCRVQTQYETSVSIADEGPHLDLRDWIHFTSEWVDARRTRKKWFLVPTIQGPERSRFPEVPGWELRDAVLSQGGPGWAELVKEVQSPHDSPAGVDVSTIRIRAVCGSGATQEVVATIEWLMPMGC